MKPQTNKPAIYAHRKTRSLLKWLGKITGVDVCWIEGIDENDNPTWGIIKKISDSLFLVKSKKLIAGSALGILLMTPSIEGNAQTTVELSSLTGHKTGFTLLGESSNDRSGVSVTSGDINGDGFEDLIIGARSANSGYGRVYIIFGGSTEFESSIELSSISGTSGYIINGFDNGYYNRIHLGVGDINGDGYDDILWGDYYAEPTGNNYSGAAYLIFGDQLANADADDGSTDGVIELSAMDGTFGYIFNSFDRDGYAGYDISAGDIDGDGYDEILIGVPSADFKGLNTAGKAFLIFGDELSTADANDGTTDGIIELRNFDNSFGYVLGGPNIVGEAGGSLFTGDINGDGVKDLLIGAHSASNGGDRIGETIVVFGDMLALADAADDTTDGYIALSHLDGETGFRMIGQSERDEFGRSVISADINGDGIDDLIASSPEGDIAGSSYGEVNILFGTTAAFDSTFQTSDLNGINGFVFTSNQSVGEFGEALAYGNLNGDGIPDLIIGQFRANSGGTPDAGITHILFGSSNSFPTSSSSLDGSNGFALSGTNAEDESGVDVDAVDINNDGFDEILIGAQFADPNGSNSGQSYLFYNRPVQNLTGDEGFRTLSAPVQGPVFGELLDSLFTQGFTGSDEPSGSPNVWTWDTDTQDWKSLSDIDSDSLHPGTGFLIYAFADDNGPHVSGNTGFPKNLSANRFGGEGTINDDTINPVSDLADSEFFFAGNPYLFPIDWDELTKSGLSNTVYVYDDANSTWQTWNGSTGGLTDGHIAPFQGFFVEGAGGSGSLTIEEADTISTSAALLKQTRTKARILKIHAEAGGLTADSWLSFQEGGESGRDPFDGRSLKPLSTNYLRLTTIIENDLELQINALPTDQLEEIQLPFDLSGVLDSDVATISFEDLDNFEGWEITVFDLETEQKFPVEEGRLLNLSIRKEKNKKTSPIGFPTLLKSQSEKESSRYVLILKPATSISREAENLVPTSVELHQNYPNPFNPVTQISFSVPDNAPVSLTIFDLWGRKISEPVNEMKKSGNYTVPFNALGLASGVYIYRLRVGNVIISRKMTLLK